MNEINTVKIQGQCYLLNGTMRVPKADGNREYELIKQWLLEGNTPEPEFREEEVIEQEEMKARSNRKNLGIDYTNLEGIIYKVSLTNEDANGLIQVKTAFEFGITETNFECSNGTIVPIKSLEDLLHLGEFVVTERNKFFL